MVALTQSGHSRRTYPLSGPQALTRIEQVQAIGRDLELVEITPEEFRREMSAYIPHDIISMLLRYWSDTTTTPDTVHTGVADVTGRSGRTLEQWAQDHRTDFTM